MLFIVLQWNVCVILNIRFRSHIDIGSDFVIISYISKTMEKLNAFLIKAIKTYVRKIC